ncbi:MULTISPECIES: hypothetical protein [Tenacibaculum]|uniref:hypothetical protein n=1 Tax=Tenacibaculum TaxID=104267 RepID=UPI001F0ADDDA|nr:MULTISPECIES: hypothetical protein [Tenacibaculum]MCH3881587.1 hypothetical protein [Tenacibaculum aquimarinum]MDO6598824.1 hypothetical protein [Tenacibaculum sp. 1_MG-2023]
MSGIFLIFVIIPLSFLLLIIAGLTEEKVFAYIVAFVWGGMIFFLIIGSLLKPFYTKKILDKEDFYGQYVIDRDYFPGKQADWQYNNFRFEIKENDSIYFYVTDKNRIINTHTGYISTVKPYQSERLKINTLKPSHHVINSNPTIYRGVWSFIMVFKSSKYHNMYFKKRKWEPINN